MIVTIFFFHKRLINQRKVEWPTREELIQLHSQYSNVKIGKMYGVLDKSISKWLKHYNIV